MHCRNAIASLRHGFGRGGVFRAARGSTFITISASRKLVRDSLKSARSVNDAWLESSSLVAIAIEKSREYVVLNPASKLSEEQSFRLMRLVELRQREMPVAYISGVQEFWGLKFGVNSSTLIPRPETEILISTALRLAKHHGKVLDLGTGTGCIVLSILNELRSHVDMQESKANGLREGWRGCAVDISKDALSVAKKNAEILGLSDAVQFIHANWTFEIDGRSPPRVHPGLRKPFDIVVSNPPYLTDEDWTRLPKSVAEYEPKLALNGSKDGLEAYRALARQVPCVLKEDGHLIVEIGAWQERDVRRLFENAMNHKASVRDACGRMRCLVFKKAPL